MLFNRMQGGHPSDDPLILSEKLGSGLTADVYLARSSESPFKIRGAIKIFKHPKYDKMAAKEAESLQKINHPNSVKILEFG